MVTQQTIQGLTSYILFSIRLARHLSGACCQLWSELTQKQPFQRRGNISCHKRLSTGVSQKEKVDGKSAALHNSDFLSQEGLSRHLVRSPIYHRPCSSTPALNAAPVAPSSCPGGRALGMGWRCRSPWLLCRAPASLAKLTTARREPQLASL